MNTRQRLRETAGGHSLQPRRVSPRPRTGPGPAETEQARDGAALGMQYLSIFENYGDIKLEEVGRLPELLHALAGIPGEFWPRPVIS